MRGRGGHNLAAGQPIELGKPHLHSLHFCGEVKYTISICNIEQCASGDELRLQEWSIRGLELSFSGISLAYIQESIVLLLS